MRSGNLLILTGERGSGKTTLLQRLVKRKTAQGGKVGGLLTPARFEAGEKTGIYVVDLHSGETRLFASKKPAEMTGFTFCEWIFDPQVLMWGNQVLASAESADLFIIDEIGPMELEQGEGWTNALTLLAKGAKPNQTMLAVVRSECLQEAVKRFSPRWTVHMGADMERTFEQLCALTDNS